MFNNDEIFNLIATHIFHSLVFSYKQHPEWINSKYKSYPWLEENFAQKFIDKLSKTLVKYPTKEKIYNYIVKFLSGIVDHQFFQSIQWFNLVTNLHSLWASHPEISNQSQYISLLLLDVENIKLSEEIEHIVTQICEYPLLIKLAFGNWKKLGQKDLNLHERNYQLIHVPSGKNNADWKIIEIGKFLINQDINIQEVFVVSSDTDLDDFCDFLIKKGLTLYRVTRNLDMLSIFNSKTGKTNYYPFNCLNKIPSLPDFINQVQEIIKEETVLRSRNWVKIPRVYQIFNHRYKQNINKILAHYFPNQTNPWQTMKYDFAVHSLDNEKHLYLSIFDGKYSEKIASKDKKQSFSGAKIELSNLNSPQNLEQAIYQIIEDLISQSDQDFTILSKVATKFNTEYKISLTKIIKRLKLNKKLPKLIESYPNINLRKVKSNYHLKLNKINN